MSAKDQDRDHGEPPRSFAQGPKDKWDRKMKQSYEQGGALKELSERGREDFRTGNTSKLP